MIYSTATPRLPQFEQWNKECKRLFYAGPKRIMYWYRDACFKNTADQPKHIESTVYTFHKISPQCWVIIRCICEKSVWLKKSKIIRRKNNNTFCVHMRGVCWDSYRFVSSFLYCVVYTVICIVVVFRLFCFNCNFIYDFEFECQWYVLIVSIE